MYKYFLRFGMLVHFAIYVSLTAMTAWATVDLFESVPRGNRWVVLVEADFTLVFGVITAVFCCASAERLLSPSTMARCEHFVYNLVSGLFSLVEIVSIATFIISWTMFLFAAHARSRDGNGWLFAMGVGAALWCTTRWFQRQLCKRGDGA